MGRLLAFLLLASCHLACLGQGAGTAWVGTWAAAPIGTAVNAGQPSPDDVTYRNIVHISIGGAVARVQLTNEFGVANLKVEVAHIAISAGNGAIQPESDRELTFSGRTSVEIPAGAFVLSDPIIMPVASLTDLAVSLYLPSQTIRVTTCHTYAYSTQYVMKGDATSSLTAGDSSNISAWCFLKGIDVLTRTAEHTAAIVTLGDSITDGSLSTPNANRCWPDILAARLQGDERTAHISVLNEGIGSNRVLHDGYAQNAISTCCAGAPTRDQSLGATLTPYMGFVRSTQEGEQIRQTYNQWVRSGGIFDGVIDFDKTTRDPARPDTFLPQYGASDHIHPNDAGYKAMGDAIDLSLFM